MYPVMRVCHMQGEWLLSLVARKLVCSITLILFEIFGYLIGMHIRTRQCVACSHGCSPLLR